MTGPGAIAAGAGPTVVLIPSSASTARQWRSLIEAESSRRHLIAFDLMGCGATPPWAGPGAMSLDDERALIAGLVPEGRRFSIVGHSMGGSVAMAAAAMFAPRVDRLVLIEPNAFFLLAQAGASAGLDEARVLAGHIAAAGTSGDWRAATEFFCEYWLGTGSWAAMQPERREKLIAAIPPLAHEAEAVFGERRTMEDWAAVLPDATTVILARDAVPSIREIVGLMRAACPRWRFVELPEGGHMAPLTHPHIVNPVIAEALGPPLQSMSCD